MAYTLAELTVMSNDIYTGLVEKSKLPFIANTRWNTPAQGATTVEILSVGDVTFEDYTANTNIATDQTPAPAVYTLEIDQKKAWSVVSDDTQRLVPGYVQAVTQKASEKAALLIDAYILALATKANFTTNWIAGDSDAAIALTGSNAISYLQAMNENLAAQNVPEDQRFVALPPKLYTKILIGIQKAGLAAQPSTDALFAGRAIQVAGMNILQTNQYSVITSSDYRVLYGHVDAIAAAYAPPMVESERVQKQFADRIKGVVQYGASVIDAKLGGAAYFSVGTES